MKTDKYALIMWAVILLAFGFVVGWIFGYSAAISKMISVASEFVQIDENLIKEYLAKAGL